MIYFSSFFSDRYLLRRSQFSVTVPVDSIIIGPFPPSIKSISFWVHLKGPDVGSVFVWLDSALVMQFSSEFSKDWQKVWIKSTAWTTKLVSHMLWLLILFDWYLKENISWPIGSNLGDGASLHTTFFGPPLLKSWYGPCFRRFNIEFNSQSA